MYLLSSMVFFRKIISLSSFFQSLSFLFDALLHSNTSVGSVFGLPNFLIYKHFAVTLCSVSLSFWFRSVYVSSNHSKCLDAGVNAFSLISYPNITIASSICFLTSISTLLHFIIVMSITIKSCKIPCMIVRYQKVSLNIVNVLWTTFASLCEILLSSMYQIFLHWFPLNILFAMHLSYGFI